MKTEGETDLFYSPQPRKSKMADLEQTMLYLTPLPKLLEVQGVGKPPELCAKLCENVHFLSFIAGVKFSNKGIVSS